MDNQQNPRAPAPQVQHLDEGIAVVVETGKILVDKPHNQGGQNAQFSKDVKEAPNADEPGGSGLQNTKN